MKTRTLIIGALATLATVAAPMAASAQHWRGDRDRDGRYERWERREDRRDYRRDYRYDRRYAPPRYAPPPPPRYAHVPRRYYRGATLPYEYRSRWYVRDYNRYGYGPPPRGYGYYRTDTGDIVLAALATGVIISLLN
ncbi:MAG: RcnB family protein [Brevundimonas sp.]|uniref:RcnB family protein n=1 Tax=Brevundimonas sp. TaxID=1871086 RepID=UPI0027344D6E|nr:RcnB family protein [Brevundimonas sp.]MDP3403888.1 RcnB family protein [Brevundimonas sp.]